jgi:hypothetical protein
MSPMPIKRLIVSLFISVHVFIYTVSCPEQAAKQQWSSEEKERQAVYDLFVSGTGSSSSAVLKPASLV